MIDCQVAAIHQPNFFPWLGFFEKISRADVFVVLDNAQHTKTGSNWSNRTRLLIAGQARWVTAPVERPRHGVCNVNEVRWGQTPWRDKMIKTLATNYHRAPFYAETLELVQPLIENPEPTMARYNLRAIGALSQAMGLQTSLVLASDLMVETTSTTRLIDLTKAVNCNCYLAGGGALGYQDDGLFSQAGMRLEFQRFSHPVYPQVGRLEFTPGLSIIDALMNCGIAQTRQILSS
ncbi:MAG: WbqC family protein [Burkholderiaceae bacterium]